MDAPAAPERPPAFIDLCSGSRHLALPAVPAAALPGSFVWAPSPEERAALPLLGVQPLSDAQVYL